MRGTDLKSFKIEHQELAESKKEFVPETGLSTFFSKLVFSFFVSNQPSKLIFMIFFRNYRFYNFYLEKDASSYSYSAKKWDEDYL